jgi:hypothetical protein
MDWEKFAQTWGPAIPITMVLTKMLYDIIYKIVPDGFRSMRRTARRHAEEAKARHAEHMEALNMVIDELALHEDEPSYTPKSRTNRRRARVGRRKSKQQPPALRGVALFTAQGWRRTS